jgi:hypothetical protein
MNMHLPAGDLNDLDSVFFKNKRMGIRYWLPILSAKIKVRDTIFNKKAAK